MTDDYFVRISDAKHTEVLRLHIARRVLLCSGSYLLLKEIREQKAQYTNHLKEQMNSIAHLFHELESLLPHHELLKEVEKSDAKPAKVSAPKPIHSPVSASSHKMDKLQEALALIEKKIESLDL